MEVLILSNLVALILLIWLKSDAIVEWGTLFGLSKLLMIDEFYRMRTEETNLGINYPTFLKIKYNNFIVNLLSCPLCLSVWLSSFISFVLLFLGIDIILLIPTITVLSLITYGIITILLKL